MMSPEAAKEYVNQRYVELTEDNPNWPRTTKVNLILKELWSEFKFILTTPTGHLIVSVTEDDQGIVYEVPNLVR